MLHDYGHSGTTNDFLVHISDERAVTYNDVSPNENHHACAGLRLLFEDRHNFLAHLSQVDYALRRLQPNLQLLERLSFRCHSSC